MALLISIIVIVSFVNAFDTYSITPQGKVWDFDPANQTWNILDQSSVSMSVRM